MFPNDKITKSKIPEDLNIKLKVIFQLLDNYLLEFTSINDDSNIIIMIMDNFNSFTVINSEITPSPIVSNIFTTKNGYITIKSDIKSDIKEFSLLGYDNYVIPANNYPDDKII